MPRHSALHVMALEEFRKLAVAWMPKHEVEHAMACEIERIDSVEDVMT